MTETFKYDNLDRLDTVLFNNTVSRMEYDTDGNSDEDSFTGALYYLHRDHLGSVTTITNSSGAIVQELSYDAWGNLRDPYTWSGSFTGTPKFDRGFTGHEHHSHFGLINMNGRMYDPLMCSFLSVDTYVQDPGNAQNFNRYAYCLNNPLRYVDPSGDFLTWSINQHGFSIGVNFTPAGVPWGVGINVSWANGGSIGLYAEAAYRVGSWGAGAQFSNYGSKKNMTFGFLDKEKMDYYGLCQQLFDVIDNGGFVMVNCESAIGHAVGVERITHTVRSNMWGNIISEYSFRVMNPAPVHYGGGYRPLSGYDIWSARNVGWLNIR